jgi:hypothetical protein
VPGVQEKHCHGLPGPRSVLLPPNRTARRGETVVFRWLAAGDAGDLDMFEEVLHSCRTFIKGFEHVETVEDSLGCVP